MNNQLFGFKTTYNICNIKSKDWDWDCSKQTTSSIKNKQNVMHKIEEDTLTKKTLKVIITFHNGLANRKLKCMS